MGSVDDENPDVAKFDLPLGFRKRKRRWHEKLADLFRKRYQVAVYGERMAGKTTLIQCLQTSEFPLAPEATLDAIEIKATCPVELVDSLGVGTPVRTKSIVDMGGDESFRESFKKQAEKANLILYLLPAHRLGIPEDQLAQAVTVSSELDRLDLSQRYKDDLKAICEAASKSGRKPTLCIIVTYADKLGFIPRLWARLTDHVRKSPQIAKVMRRQGIFREVRVITGSLKDERNAGSIWKRVIKLHSPQSAPGNMR